MKVEKVGTEQQNLEEMRLLELKLFIIEFNKASQLDRSFGKSISKEIKQLFRNKLIETCLELMSLVDNGRFNNLVLREHISELKNLHLDISYGQAQKVVNVVMKQYCFILNKKELYKELDCPLDSTTMKKKHTMKRLTEGQYLEHQNNFKVKNNGIPILEDQVYDSQRIEKFSN